MIAASVAILLRFTTWILLRCALCYLETLLVTMDGYKMI